MHFFKKVLSWVLATLSKVSKFAITHKNDAFGAKMANACLTKTFVAIFALAERQSSSATLSPPTALITASLWLTQSAPWEILSCQSPKVQITFHARLLQQGRRKMHLIPRCFTFCAKCAELFQRSKRREVIKKVDKETLTCLALTKMLG